MNKSHELPRKVYASEEHQMFKKTVNDFFQTHILPHREKYEKQGYCDKSAWLKAGELGLLGITIQGGERFVLRSAEAQSNQLVLGQVEMLEDHPAAPMHEKWSSMLDVLTSLEAHPHVQRLGYAVDHGDAWQVGYALAQLLPVDDSIKYGLLGETEIELFMEELDDLLNQLGGLTA